MEEERKKLLTSFSPSLVEESGDSGLGLVSFDKGTHIYTIHCKIQKAKRLKIIFLHLSISGSFPVPPLSNSILKSLFNIVIMQ